MKKALILLASVLLVAFFCAVSLAAVKPAKVDEATKVKVLESYGKLPLSFVQNKGQVDKKVSYYLNGRQGTIYFTKGGIVYVLSQETGSSEKIKKGSVSKETRPKEFKRLSFTLKPVSRNKAVRLVSGDKLPGRVNYLIGNDKGKWHTDIPIYQEIIYKDLYDGIDLKVYGTNNQMEYDFIVAAGADPRDIRMAFDGINALKVDKDGNLIIKTAFSEQKHLKPVIYQEIDGTRHMVEGSFRVAKTTFSFDVGAYDKNHPLVIDPLTLSYSTYLGGSSGDEGYSICVDTSGNAYVTGRTISTDFPTVNPYQGTNGGGNDVFVTKVNATGNALSYSTYLGGSSTDRGHGICVDTSGNAYVTGYTYSTNFPIENPYQGTRAGSNDAFVTKVNATGNALSYSTYLGGSDADYGYGISVDTSGNAYVTGQTGSTDFPIVNPYQGTSRGYDDAFVTKVRARAKITSQISRSDLGQIWPRLRRG